MFNTITPNGLRVECETLQEVADLENLLAGKQTSPPAPTKSVAAKSVQSNPATPTSKLAATPGDNPYQRSLKQFEEVFCEINNMRRLKKHTTPQSALALAKHGSTKRHWKRNLKLTPREVFFTLVLNEHGHAPKQIRGALGITKNKDISFVTDLVSGKTHVKFKAIFDRVWAKA